MKYLFTLCFGLIMFSLSAQSVSSDQPLIEKQVQRINSEMKSAIGVDVLSLDQIDKIKEILEARIEDIKFVSTVNVDETEIRKQLVEVDAKFDAKILEVMSPKQKEIFISKSSFSVRQ